MRSVTRMGLALLMALALSTSVSAQSFDDRVSLNAAVGPSFANLGTTFSTTAGVDYRLNDRTALVGEFGMLSHAPFRDASEIAAPLSPDVRGRHVNAFHWNANVKVRPFEYARVEPYLTAGMGSFTADTVVGTRLLGATPVDDHQRITDLATNLGGGIRYQFTDWIGLTADYRTFFVHREDDTRNVNRFTTGLTFSLK